MTVDVLVEIKARGIDQTFTYFVEANLKDKVCVGKRVLVPFGKQNLEGFILEVGNKEVDFELKPILDVIDDEPVLNEEMLELGKYISKKTLCNLISSYQTMLPSALKAKKGYNINKKYVTYLKIKDNSYIGKNEKQKEILNLFKEDILLKSIATKISVSAVNTLIKNNIIEEIHEEIYRINNDSIKEEKKIELTSEQRSVVDKVLNSKNKFHPFLLHGVTGSGKTEVYMHIIEEVIKEQEVIVLVPEISLTPQLVNLFRKRFGEKIAIMHSGLNDGEKYDEWRKVLNHEVKIVIGARSAIFVPFTNLGLIIIDEEHTDTYKQDNNPKYNAIDIAIYRSKYHNCPLLLGSATPLIESYTRAKTGTYELLELPNRINKQLPLVELVDMKNEIRKGNTIISNKLNELIIDRIKKEEQTILLLNRRGYSTTIICQECGYTLKCPNCEIPLTYHKKHNKMVCHYCEYTTFRPFECPNCKSKKINSLGLGTERLQEEIEKKYNVKTLRMDIDTTSKKGSHEKIISAFRNKEALILIGTQMIAKGLDFEDVTLVGVINGDSSLNIPDYRSAERTFDLLNQVAGRSGRSKKKGNVVIQGFNIDHYSIKRASEHDYLGFYNEEMNIRKILKYPPYIDITLIKIISTNYELCYSEANKIAEYLRKNKNINILGPSSSNMPKINNNYYIQIIIKYKKLKDLYGELKYINNLYKKNNKIKVEIDINPKKI